MRPVYLRGIRRIKIRKECKTLLISLDKVNLFLNLNDNNHPHDHQINPTKRVFFSTVKIGCSLEYPVWNLSGKVSNWLFFNTVDTSLIKSANSSRNMSKVGYPTFLWIEPKLIFPDFLADGGELKQSKFCIHINFPIRIHSNKLKWQKSSLKSVKNWKGIWLYLCGYTYITGITAALWKSVISDTNSIPIVGILRRQSILIPRMSRYLQITYNCIEQDIKW